MSEISNIKFDNDFSSYKCNWASEVVYKDQPSTREVFNSRKVFEKILSESKNVIIQYKLSEGRYNWGAIAWYKVDDVFPQFVFEENLTNRFSMYKGHCYMPVACINDGPADTREDWRWGVYEKLKEQLDMRLADNEEDFYRYWLKEMKYVDVIYKDSYKPYLPWSWSEVNVNEAQPHLKPEFLLGFDWLYKNRAQIKQEVLKMYEMAVDYWYKLRDSGEKSEEKKPKGYTAVLDNLDGSFSFICFDSDENKVKSYAESSYDNERVRVYPYYENPYEVL